MHISGVKVSILNVRGSFEIEDGRLMCLHRPVFKYFLNQLTNPLF